MSIQLYLCIAMTSTNRIMTDFESFINFEVCIRNPFDHNEVSFSFNSSAWPDGHVKCSRCNMSAIIHFSNISRRSEKKKLFSGIFASVSSDF